MSTNRLLIAAAGSGKTKFIIDNVLTNKTERMLITTFTLANERSIRERLAVANGGFLPSNLTIQTWFSFLIEHGIRPYRYWNERVNGMIFCSEPSGIKYSYKNGRKIIKVRWGEEENLKKHYFDKNMNVYSDKLSKLFYRCNEKSNGYVIKRLEKVFKNIYIDEVQDMAGWDLELIRLILRSTISLTMVGDPRQTVYLTHHDDKYKKYKYGKVKEFIQEKCTRKNEYCYIDTETLCSSYRNIEQICILSSKLYPSISACSSSLTKTNSHVGIYFVHMCEVEKYYKLYKPIQLRLRQDVELPIDVPSMTFGMSKGLEAEHVLIYPTSDMLKWLSGQKINFAPKTQAQLYVALTRAFFSVGIVVDDDFNKKIDGIKMWQ